MMQRYKLPTLFIFVLTMGTYLTPANAEKIYNLRKMNVNRDTLTLSGFSSGGTFAQQMQLSYAKMFQGIAVFSHTYYRCGPINGDMMEWDRVCSKLGNLTEDNLYAINNSLIAIDDYYSKGLIENPKSLRNKKLYVYAGLENYLFTLTQSLRILNIYEPYIGNLKNIKTVIQNSGLLLPSNKFGGDCAGTPREQFFIGKCNYSGPEDALQFLMAPHPIRSPRADIKLQPLLTFNQTEFFSNERNDMDTEGFIYIPKACRKNNRERRNVDIDNDKGLRFHGSETKCHLHFYFHGCLSGRVLVGDNHVVHSGYLELAETNRIITVFPQVVNSTENPNGCWDVFGVTGPQFATRRGAQVRVVKRILDKILDNQRN